MSEETKNIESLLKKVKSVVKQQKEIEVLKGENFNVFSILKMESKENATHSAFLGELLNPKGSHSKGGVFLKLFLETISYIEPNGKNEQEKETLDKPRLVLDKAKVKLEHYVGVKDIENKTGGRIDIYIWDNEGNTISIENKIYANDQEAQIERYCNHNKIKNTVYYLTLSGEDASKGSRGELNDQEHYYCISYESDIVNWLESCLKESADHPILRESIKQYIILIKKLTNQLTSNKMSEKIIKLISENYNTSKIIASNIKNAEIEATAIFLEEIKTELKKDLKKGWTITIDEDLNNKWKGLKIIHDTWDGVKVKLEGHPRVFDCDSHYGIHAPEANYNREDIKSRLAKSEVLTEEFKDNHAWTGHKYIFSMNSTSNKVRLFEPEKRKSLVEDVALKLKELALECLPLLSGVKRIEKVKE